MMAAGTMQYIPRGELRLDEPMTKHTSWRTGGLADKFYMPADRQDLVQFLGSLQPDTPVTWVGLGSNLLVRDGGIRGVVIATHKCLGRLERIGSNRIYAEAGVPGAKLARFSVRSGLRGAEFFAGIPGTFGGALAMNAGAFGSETWDVVSKVEMVDESGRVVVKAPMEFRIDYRDVRIPHGSWFLGGEIVLEPGDTVESQRRVKEFLARRSTTQPIQTPNAGSVFRNPEGDYAARLIEASGLKGARVGGACVSNLHANFIVNDRNATSLDIERLITHIQTVVESEQGVRLKREVRILGEAVQGSITEDSA